MSETPANTTAGAAAEEGGKRKHPFELQGPPASWLGNTLGDGAQKEFEYGAGAKRQKAANALKDVATVVAQLRTPDGELVAGPPVELPLDITPHQLNILLNKLLNNDDKLPYSFHLNETEITADLRSTVADQGASIEECLSIVYMPQAVFRVRAVTRCTSTLAGHSDAIVCVAFAPDGSTLATGNAFRVGASGLGLGLTADRACEVLCVPRFSLISLTDFTCTDSTCTDFTCQTLDCSLSIEVIGGVAGDRGLIWCGRCWRQVGSVVGFEHRNSAAHLRGSQAMDHVLAVVARRQVPSLGRQGRRSAHLESGVRYCGSQGQEGQEERASGGIDYQSQSSV